MDVEKAEKSQKGFVLAAECVGTAFLIVAYSIGGQMLPGLPLAMVYFILLVLVLPFTGANLNPAISVAVAVSNKRTDAAKALGMVIVSQYIGGLIGLSFGLIWRCWQNGQPEPPIIIAGLGIDKYTYDTILLEGYNRGAGFFVCFSVEMIMTFVLCLVFLVVKDRWAEQKETGEVFIVCLPVAISLAFCNKVTSSITSGYNNPVVGFVLGIMTRKYYSLDGLLTNPLWTGYWGAFSIGPYFGGILAGLFYLYYKKVMFNIGKGGSDNDFYEKNDEPEEENFMQQAEEKLIESETPVVVEN